MKLPFSNPRTTQDVQRNVLDVEQRVGSVGAGELNWAGATSLSDVAVVSHKLGVVPKHVFAQVYVPIGNSSTRGFTVEVDDATFTATTFQVRGWCGNAQPSAGTKLRFSWRAIP